MLDLHTIGQVSTGQTPAPVQAALAPSTARGIEFVRRIDEVIAACPQVEITTHHMIHEGVYYRSMCVPKGVVLTSVLFKIPTALVVSGRAVVVVGDGEEVLVEGYHVFATAAGREVAIIAHEDTWGTMSFRTNARTVEEAEAEFTDELDRLLSRRGANEVMITGS